MRWNRRSGGRVYRFGALMTMLALGLLLALPITASSAAGGTTLAIGVGHSDPDNQQFDHLTGNPITGGRIWSYTDFFTREVSIHSGDTLDFQTPPGEFHTVVLAKNATAFRAANPIFLPDLDDPPAPGSGVAKGLFGPGVNILFSSPTCGVMLAGQSNCTFDGTTPTVAGAIGGAHVKKLLQLMNPKSKVTPAAFNGTVDWNVTVNAAPGDYDYFCLLHPLMNGRLHVVGPDEARTTQGQVNTQSLAQFAADKAEAQAQYVADNTPTSTGPPGHRVFAGHAGDNTPDGHVAFFEMMPRNLNLAVGDSVHWTWGSEAEIHTVSFPANSPTLPPPFAPDCGQFGGDDVAIPPPPAAPLFCGDPPPPGSPPNPAAFEFALDPGTARPGNLSSPAALVDAGTLVGAGYGLSPSVQDWSARASTAGTYAYQCTIHDWMQATVTVS